MQRVLILAVLAVASLFFTSCKLNDDTESKAVDPAAMGATLNTGAVLMANWGTSVSGSTDSVPSQGTTMTVTLSKTSALGKLAVAAGNTVTVDSTNRALGYVTIAVTIPGAFGFQITYDTAKVKYDAQFKDNIKDNENVIEFSQTVVYQNPSTSVPTGAVDRAAYTDVDGDGIVSPPVAGRTNKVKAVFTHSDKFLGQPLLATGTIIVGPGADNNYNTGGDNIVYQAIWDRTWGGTPKASISKTR